MVSAVSLRIGGAARLIRPSKLYMCTQNTTYTDESFNNVPVMVLYQAQNKHDWTDKWNLNQLHQMFWKLGQISTKFLKTGFSIHLKVWKTGPAF